MPKQQACAENAIEKAFSVVMSRNIEFNHDRSESDQQIDIGPVYMVYAGEGKNWTSGNKKEALLADFMALDKKKSYFMRSGQVGSAGHHQLLSFDLRADGWRGYSSEANQTLYTRGNGLTEEAEGSLMTNSLTARWGTLDGEYMIALQEATPERIIAAANYVHDCRMAGGEEKAVENLYNDQLLTLKTTNGFIHEHAALNEPLVAEDHVEIERLYETYMENIQHRAGSVEGSKKALFEKIFLLDDESAIDQILKLTERMNSFIENVGPALDMGTRLRLSKEDASIEKVLNDRLDAADNGQKKGPP